MIPSWLSRLHNLHTFAYFDLFFHHYTDNQLKLNDTKWHLLCSYFHSYLTKQAWTHIVQMQIFYVLIFLEQFVKNVRRHRIDYGCWKDPCRYHNQEVKNMRTVTEGFITCIMFCFDNRQWGSDDVRASCRWKFWW